MASAFASEVAAMQGAVVRVVGGGVESSRQLASVRALYAREWLARREQNRRLMKLWGPLRVVCWVPDTATLLASSGGGSGGAAADALAFVADEGDNAVRVVHPDGRQQQFSYHRVHGPHKGLAEVWAEYEDSIQMAMMGQRGCLFHMFPASSFLVRGQSHGHTRELLDYLTAINEHVWHRLFAAQEDSNNSTNNSNSPPGADAGASAGASTSGGSIQYKYSVSYLVVHCGDVFDLLSNAPSSEVRREDVKRGDFSRVEVLKLEEALQLTGLGSRKRVDLAVRAAFFALHPS
jgi:hypothetical protein